MNFKMIDTEDEKISEVINSSYELKKDHILYQTEYYSTDKNEDLGMWEDKYNNLTLVLAKTHVVSLEMSFGKERWKIVIKMVNDGANIWIFYKTQKEAQKAFDEIYKWLYNS